MALHVVVSCRIRMEVGPTMCGDEQSDPELMKSIGAEYVKEIGNNFNHWQCPDSPRVVLDRLDAKGYRLVAMAGIGQTCVWTLRKDNIAKIGKGSA